nr:MFS transporter [Nitrospiraceae bacterium]
METWYLAYALMGTTIAGLAPILLPLYLSRSGSAAQVGLVMAAFSIGGLTAPVWGAVADKYRLHRILLAGGLFLAAAGLGIFPLAISPAAWLWLAFMQSVGSACAATIANLFVVEAHPKSEWDRRIGWLQTFYGSGQVIGLFIASIFSREGQSAGLFLAAGLTFLGILPGWFATHTPDVPPHRRPRLQQPVRHAEWPASGSPLRFYHYITLGAIREIKKAERLPFVRFLLSWFLSYTGSAAVFSLYPVLMRKAYGVPPYLSSLGFAVAAGIGLALYIPAGKLSDSLGAKKIFQAALGVRLLAAIGLLLLGGTHFTDSSWFALAGFSMVVFSWSLLSVSGTALTAQLAPSGN